MIKALFQFRSWLASSTMMPRSRQLNTGRFTCRSSTITCWRSSAFSSISSDLLRVASATAPLTKLLLFGRVHSHNLSTARNPTAFNPRLTKPGKNRRMTRLSSDRVEQRGYCTRSRFRRKFRTDVQIGQHNPHRRTILTESAY
jgi:hypothetical protein